MSTTGIDEAGKRYGNFTVIRRVDTGEHGIHWICKCDCGKEKIISGSVLRQGKSYCECQSTKPINEIGNRYGKLLVTERASFLNNPKVSWICICDCGRQAVVFSSTLRNGEVKDCGFCSRKKAMKNQFGNRMIDETGKQYGRLIVLFPVRANKRGEIRWCCQCKCGNKTVIPGSYLRTENTRSCGCLEKENLDRIHESRIIDETGKKYGRWTVIERGFDDRHGAFWLCKCECGEERIVLGTSLRNGESRSCGCLSADMASERAWLPFGESSKRKLFSVYKSSARHRGLKWNLTKDEFLRITQQPCHYCGVEPKQICLATETANGEYIYNGIDRKDSSIGYIPSNVVPCCKACNYAKNKLSYDEFLDLIKRIAINMELIHG